MPIRHRSFLTPMRHASFLMPRAWRVIAILAAVGSLDGCRQESRIPSRPPTSVRLAAVTTVQTSGEALRYSASIFPFAQVDLAFRTPGYVTEVNQMRGADGRIRDVGTGDYVEKGTVLARVRLEDMKNQVAQAQAQLDQAVALHTQADQDFGRAKILFASQSLTKPDYDQSQQRFNSTLAAMDNAKAALRQAELTLGDSDLKAPFSGFILNRYIDSGSLASPSSPAFTIADISSAKATFGVPDYALSRVH
jgi:RND family efflux transporter MFP subunit